MKTSDVTFDGSIPERYDRYLGPALFDPYARDLAARLPAGAMRVLEVACGTGIATRHLRAKMPAGARLTATDLSDGMVAFAGTHLPAPAEGAAVEFRAADACALPFADRAYGAVVCQFGVMFVPDKGLCFREARRVLAPGGTFLFSVWDALSANLLTHVVDGAIRALYPVDPPEFYAIPFGFHDDAVIRPLLSDAGFTAITRDTVPAVTHSPSAREMATGLVTGTPMATAIRERGTIATDAVLDAVTAALTARFGAGPIAAPMRAIVYTAQ